MQQNEQLKCSVTGREENAIVFQLLNLNNVFTYLVVITWEKADSMPLVLNIQIPEERYEFKLVILRNWLLYK